MINGGKWVGIRKSRVLEYMCEATPLPVREIAAREGITERWTRTLIKALERETGLTYRGWGLHFKTAMGDETYALRSRLADQLHQLIQKVGSRAEVAALTGVNSREQLRAINRPFHHDWTLSQIERLAQALADL